MLRYHLKNINGFIAVSTDMHPDWYEPVMSGTAWVSKHKWDVNADIWQQSGRIEAGRMEGDKQYWGIVMPTGSRVEFSTPHLGGRIVGIAIAKPRKKKGQANPWRWGMGSWTNTAIIH